VAELADALDLGSSTARCVGSSPSVRILKKNGGNAPTLDMHIQLFELLVWYELANRDLPWFFRATRIRFLFHHF
jgi:hypothetical protein